MEVPGKEYIRSRRAYMSRVPGRTPKSGMPDVLVIDSGPGAFATGLYLEAPAAPAQCTYLPMAGLPGLNTAGMSGRQCRRQAQVGLQIWNGQKCQ